MSLQEVVAYERLCILRARIVWATAVLVAWAAGVVTW